MDRNELRKRTKAFALRIIRLAAALPKNRTGNILGRQLLRAGTSIGANYREALCVSSRKHFPVFSKSSFARLTKRSIDWNYSPMQAL